VACEAEGVGLPVQCHSRTESLLGRETPQSRIVEEGDEWVVIDKPAGVPVPPTVDNLQETCVARVAAALDASCAPLRITHRLVRLSTHPSSTSPWWNDLAKP
jgi:23S rRNA-/tRNA-specific pseudouridylate synthase